jgi:hypothetical protein
MTTAERTFALIARPDRAAVLRRAGRTWIDDEVDPEVVTVADAPVLDAAALRNVAVGLPEAAATRPVGDPVRAGIPLCRELVLDRLADPQLLIAVGARNVLGEPGRSLWQVLGAGLGAREYRDPDARWTRRDGGTRSVGSRDCGGLVVIASPAETLDHGAVIHKVHVFLRPALALRPRQRDLLDRMAATTTAAIDRLRGAGYGAIADRVRDSPVPPGGYEANPMLSVPGLVGEVADRLRLPPDAAALYLQLLVLAAPTSGRLTTINEWTPARGRSAAGRLVAAGLARSERRPGTSRRLFLPGGWVPGGRVAGGWPDDPPIEAWKLPLYEGRLSGGRYVGPLGRLTPLRPVHELYRFAWRRLSEGDRPS